MSDRAIVFGASGSLGSQISDALHTEGADVLRASRSRRLDSGWISTETVEWAESLRIHPVKRVVWAQGANAIGAIGEFSLHDLDQLFDANVRYIARTLQDMIAVDGLLPGARLCIVSSVWQLMARYSKLAYMTTKAAVGGLVRSLAVDLGPRGFSINAVLPGVVDSPMSEQFLGREAMQRIAAQSPMRRLVTVFEIASVVVWMTGSSSAGITGQSIVVDHGWSQTRHV